QSRGLADTTVGLRATETGTQGCLDRRGFLPFRGSDGARVDEPLRPRLAEVERPGAALLPDPGRLPEDPGLRVAAGFRVRRPARRRGRPGRRVTVAEGSARSGLRERDRLAGPTSGR